MNSAMPSTASVITGALAVLVGSAAASAQATVDTEDNYSNVGAIMVWRVDGSGKPVELRAFASGTLIRPRVMITAGHFTAPVKALGEIPPTIRIFASFSPTDARYPGTWIPVIALATHPSIPSYVCSGDSGGGIFLNARSGQTAERLVANVSDGGQDCRRHNNNNRLDTRAIQTWIDDSVKAHR